ncbi:hypothetical protein BJX70DRAFT_411132 [Aspergillus crustosus]
MTPPTTEMIETKTETEMERRQTFRAICAEALKVEVDDLDETCSWVALGGDSIAIIGLIARGEEYGMRVKMADMIRCCNIAELFDTIVYIPLPTDSRQEHMEPDVAPFALWPEYRDATTTEQRRTLLNAEGLMAITSRTPAAYVNRRAFSLPPTVDLTPILRTRIITDPLSGRSLQVVTRDQAVWREGTTLEEYLADERQEGITLGRPFTRCGLIHNGGTTKEKVTVFVWTVHHSIYDGWSALQLYRQLAAIYNDQNLSPAVPYTRFVRYQQEQDPSRAGRYWQDQLQGEDTIVDWSCLPTATYQPRPRAEFHDSILLPEVSGSDLVMMSMVLRAAWALVMGQYSGHNDVVFGVTLSGRNALVPQVSDITAPLITTVRVRLDHKLTVAGFLEQTQQQATEMIEFEHTGLQQIKTCSRVRCSAGLPEPVIIQPAVERDLYQAFPGLSPVSIPAEDFDAYALMVECTLGRQRIDVQVNYDDDVIETAALTSVMDKFSALVRRMSSLDAQEKPLHEILTLPSQDQEQITLWNTHVPSPVARSASQSMRLAHHLATCHGVGPERTVALCMDKSKWAVVAMLAILYAGGCCPAIVCEPSITAHTGDYRRCQRKAGLERPMVTVDSTVVDALPPAATPPDSGVRPSNVAWMIYTSGTHARAIGINENTRTLQFAACTFDVSVMDTFSTLQAGGCVCVPSEEERLGSLAEAAARMGRGASQNLCLGHLGKKR